MSLQFLTLTVEAERKVKNGQDALAICRDFKAQMKSAYMDAASTMDVDGESSLGIVPDKIVLCGNSYKPDGAQVLAAFCTAINDTVTKLDMSDIIASQPEEQGLEVLKLISDAFSESKLEYLRNCDNALGSKGINACMSVIGGQAKTLKHLYLENDGLAAESLQILEQILTKPAEGDSTCACDNLETLRFHDNMSGVEGAKAAGRIFAQLKHPKELRYTDCRSLGEGSTGLADGLDAMGDNIASLEKLNLAGNFFVASDKEIDQSLLHALERAKGLKHVGLRDCNLEEEGSQLVCEALMKSGAKLESIDISENDLGREDALDALVQLIVQNRTTLKKLEVEGNDLSSAGIKTIMKALGKVNSVIEIINFKTNMVGRIGAKAVLNCTMSNLQLLQFDDNGFFPEEVEALETKFGDKLEEMADNMEDDDVDEDEGIEENDDDDDVAALTEGISNVGV
mmetsp:Transcript_15206/g.21192  ORF Transcript_15206/g.21192 Transcript_15206/m.21192 type:complete len:455 (-) Transcript_15206:1095-2459(-)